jgi:serine/threonine-protein kinase
MQSALARILAISGKADRAVDTLRTLEELAATRYVSPVEFMATAFAAGDRDSGFRWLAKACDERCFEMITLRVDPRFEPLGGDDRFVAALRRIGLD